MRTTHLFIVFIGLTSWQQAGAFVTVGTDPDCDYDNLFPAYQDADLEIRVTNQQQHNNNFVIDQFKIFKGGYDNCLDAENDTPGAQLSRWSGLNALNNTVVEVHAELPILVTVVMERFEIFDGRNTTAAAGGGIKVSGKSRLILRDSRVFDNEGNEGGGIHVSGANASLVLENTVVEDNIAAGYGGGVFCTLGATVELDARSALRNNTAQFNGGGLFAGQQCQVTNHAGLTTQPGDVRGVRHNEAAKGGGVYLQTGAVYESLGGYRYPARIQFNEASQHDGPGGGGIYVTGAGTRAVLKNTSLENNQSLYHGAALVVSDQGILEMNQDSAGCGFSDSGYCSLISSNITVGVVASGAAGVLTDQGEAVIAQTHITRNRSNLTAGIDVLEQSSLTLEGNLISGHSDLSLNNAQTLFVVRGDPGRQSRLLFAHNTVTNNLSNKTFSVNGLLQGQVLDVFNSIIWDLGDVMGASGNDNQIRTDCSVLHEDQSLQGSQGVILTNDPLFINSATGDYRPSLASDAIDLCDQFFHQAQFQDLDSNPRGTDIDTVNDLLGPYDAGAYEYIGDVLFSDGFD